MSISGIAGRNGYVFFRLITYKRNNCFFSSEIVNPDIGIQENYFICHASFRNLRAYFTVSVT